MADAQWNKLMSVWPRLEVRVRRDLLRLARAFRDDQKKPGQPFTTRYTAIMDDPTLSAPEKLLATEKLLDELARLH